MRLLPNRIVERVGSSVADRLRKRAARHLELTATPERLRRGERLEATLTISGAHSVEGQLEVGLVCTETYAEKGIEDDLLVDSRRVYDDVAYEVWSPIASGQPQHTVALDVPADAPYTYRGEHLRFRWELLARQQRGGLDAQISREIEVLP